jgi:hypothetical protein
MGGGSWLSPAAWPGRRACRNAATVAAGSSAPMGLHPAWCRSSVGTPRCAPAELKRGASAVGDANDKQRAMNRDLDIMTGAIDAQFPQLRASIRAR